MTHDDIRARDIQARYAAGKLDAAEEELFEAHLVECAECADAVRTEIGLREGLRAVAAETAIRPSTPRRTFVPLAAAAMLLVSVGLGAVAWRSLSALQQARNEQAALARRAGDAEASASALERQVTALQQQAQSPASKPMASPIQSAVVFALSTVRGGSPSDAPINTLTLGSSTTLVVLSMDVPRQSAAADYYLTLKDRAGNDVWSGGAFRPSTDDTLAIALDRSLLPNGDYVLELSRRSPDSRVIPITRYRFRVV